jgi:hypothetical protein
VRKIILAGALAGLASTLIAAPAGASFDRHFTVLSKSISQQRVNGNTVRFRDKLLDPRNRDNRVGSDRGRCRVNLTTGRVKCHAVVRLNGEIGGKGHIRIRGDLTRNDHRLNVVGGDGDFNGIAGKVLLHSVNRRTDRLHFDLTR